MPSGGFRESLKRRARGVKGWFGPEDQAPNPRTSPAQSQPQPPSEVLSQHTLTLQSPLPPSAQTQRPTILPQPVPNAGGSSSAANPIAADAESRLTQAAKKAGADAWTGLRATLRLVEKSSDVFPPLKSAVAGFLGVVDIFEVSDLDRCVRPCYLDTSEYRRPHKIGRIMRRLLGILRPWSPSSGRTQRSVRPVRCRRR